MIKLEIRQNENGSISLPPRQLETEAVIELQKKVEELTAALNALQSLPKVRPVPLANTTEMEEPDPDGWPTGIGSRIDNMGDQPMGFTVHIYNRNFKTIAEARAWSEQVRLFLTSDEDSSEIDNI